MCHKGLLIDGGLTFRCSALAYMFGFYGGFVIHVGGICLHEWIFGGILGAYVGGCEGT